MTDDRPVGVDTVVVSAQHSEEVTLDLIRRDIIEAGHTRQSFRPGLMGEQTKIYVNPTGRFYGRRPCRGYRSDGTQDHRRHLRRIRQARGRRLLWQGSYEGRPVGCLCRTVCGQKHRGGGPGSAL